MVSADRDGGSTLVGRAAVACDVQDDVQDTDVDPRQLVGDTKLLWALEDVAIADVEVVLCDKEVELEDNAIQPGLADDICNGEQTENVARAERVTVLIIETIVLLKNLNSTSALQTSSHLYSSWERA